MKANKAYHMMTPQLRGLSRAIKNSITDSAIAGLTKPEERDKLRDVRKRWEALTSLSQSSTNR